MRTFAVPLLAMLALAMTALGEAKVAAITLDELTGMADVIVIGEVRRVVEVDGVPVASVGVLETLKGTTEAEIHYLAASTWTCDITEAHVGERALLFLVAEELRPEVLGDDGGFERLSKRFGEELRRLLAGRPFYAVAQSGRGRMVFYEVGGEEAAAFWSGDVRLPVEARLVTGPEPEYQFIKGVPTDDLLAQVRASIARATRAAAQQGAQADEAP